MTTPMLSLVVGRNMESLEIKVDPADRATQIAPLSKNLPDGSSTFLGYARWRTVEGDSGPKTIVLADPAGGPGAIGFDNQFVNWYLLREKTAESFRITATDKATQTFTLATFPGSLIEDSAPGTDDGEFFQLRMTAPGTTLTAYSYRTSVASVIPVPPGVPIHDAEVTAVAGDVITVRDAWLSGGVQPVAASGQHIGRLVRLSERIATDQITDFSYGPGGFGSGRAIFSFADVSAYQVGDWFRRRRFTSYPYGDINQYISSAFPAGMTIIDVDTGANTVEVESRDGGDSLHRFIFDSAGGVSDEVIVYRPNATLRTVTDSDGTAHTLTLNDASGFSLGGGNGAVEILIASSSTSGRVPYYLEHPVFVAPTFPGIGVKFRTINRRNLLGVSNLAPNAVLRRWSDLATLPDGYTFANPFSFASSDPAPDPGGFFNFARNTDKLYTRVGGQSLFFSTTGGTLVFPPIAWTPQYDGQPFSARVSLYLTQWPSPAATIRLWFGIMQADGSILPWYELPRASLVQPAGFAALALPNPPYRPVPAGVWDDIVLNDFIITEPSHYTANLQPNAADIADLSNALGIVPLLTFDNGGGSARIEGYFDGVGVTATHEAPDNVSEFYDANRLHQVTNTALRAFAKPQRSISGDFVDLARMGDAEELLPEVGQPALVLDPGASADVQTIEEITEVRTNHNVEGDTEIVLGSKTRRFEEFLTNGGAGSSSGGAPSGTPTAPPPGTKPPGTNAGFPTLAVSYTVSAGIPTVTFTVSPGVVKVYYAEDPTTYPTVAATLAGTVLTTPPFGYTGAALTGERKVSAIAEDLNGVHSAMANVTLMAPPHSGSWVRSISIDHTKVGSSTHSNFPMLFAGTYAYLATVANGGKVENASGFDIGFYSDAGATTKLDWEIESWNPTTGAIVAWVKVPSVSNAVDTVIYLGYGDPSITTDQSAPANVWDANYLCVHHMGDGTTLSGADSTSNSNNFSAIGSPTPVAATGKVGGAISFSGGTSQAYAAALTLPFGSDITVSFWQKVSSGNSGGFGISLLDSPNRCQAHVPYNGDNNLYWDFGDIGAGGRISTSYSAYLGVWTYVTLVGRANGTLKEIRLNGSVAATNGSSSAPTQALSQLHWGQQIGGIYQTGDMDEARISSTVRSASWTLAEYNNQSDPAGFYAIGSEA